MEKLVASVGAEFGSRIEVMQSSAGLSQRESPRMSRCGPCCLAAGGVMGAYQMAKLAGFDRIIGFDMGERRQTFRLSTQTLAVRN